MTNEENAEIFVRAIMPLAVIASPIIISSLVFGIVLDTFFLKKTLDEPLFVALGIILFFSAFIYCFNYCKKELGYFSEINFIKHLIFMIILPALIGLGWEYSSYKSKIISVEKLN